MRKVGSSNPIQFKQLIYKIDYLSLPSPEYKPPPTNELLSTIDRRDIVLVACMIRDLHTDTSCKADLLFSDIRHSAQIGHYCAGFSVWRVGSWNLSHVQALTSQNDNCCYPEEKLVSSISVYYGCMGNQVLVLVSQ